MDWTRSLIVLVIGAVILILAVRSLRAGRLKERYALLFIFIGLPFVAMAVWRDAMGTIAHWLGIDYRTLALLLLATFVVIVNLKLLSLLSVQEQKINELAQRLAMLSERKADGD